MIRRAATRTSDSGAGYVSDGLKKTDVDENQTYVFIFERSSTGVVTEELATGIVFTDGCPAEVAAL